MSDLLLTGHIEPWRCKQCHALMYNVDSEGHPAPGAPQPKFVSHIFNEVCTACFQMVAVIRDSNYFKAESDAHYERLKKAMGGS